MYIKNQITINFSLCLCVCLSVHTVWALGNKDDSQGTVLDDVLKCSVMVSLCYGESCDRK